MVALNISELKAGSIHIRTERRMVKLDDAPQEVEQCYLTISGTPDGFQWLSQHFKSLANSASRAGAAANIVAAWDFKNRPVILDGWDSVDFSCQKNVDNA